MATLSTDLRQEIADRSNRLLLQLLASMAAFITIVLVITRLI